MVKVCETAKRFCKSEVMWKGIWVHVFWIVLVILLFYHKVSCECDIDVYMYWCVTVNRFTFRIHCSSKRKERAGYLG